MPRLSLTESVQRALLDGGERQVIFTFDARDKPPFTCELRADRRTLHVRAGTTVAAALTAALRAERLSGPLPPLQRGGRRQQPRAGRGRPGPAEGG